MAQQQTFHFPSLDGDDAGCGLPKVSAARHHPPTSRELVCRPTNVDDEKLLSAVVSRHCDDTGHISKDARRLVSTILAARGITSEAVVEGLLESDLAHLPDPSRMKNFDAALSLICMAVRTGRKIGINGDYDVDGTTAVAQIVATLSAAGACTEWHIPHREVDGYGLSDRLVQRFIESGCQIVLLFDHGTHNISQIAALRGAGIDVVVFDHHTVGATLPDAVLVNPAQPGCGFGSHRPCASGLAFFACRRIAESFALPAPHCGLAALGTIADMVPLEGANRIIARNGLEAIQNGFSRGVTHLASQLGLLPSSLSSVDVGFYVGPAINAAGRLGDSRKCVELMIGRDEVVLKRIARDLVDANEERKKIQRRQLMHNYDRLAAIPRVPRVLVASHPDHHQGVVGLTAQGLAQRYSRPAFVFATVGDGTLKGSARAGSELYDLAGMLADAASNDVDGIIIKAGGHRAAAGLTIRADKLADFVKLISGAAAKQHAAPPASAQVLADATLTLRELSPRVMQGVHRLLDPFGQNFSQPRFLFESVKVLEVDSFEGGRHMLVLEQDNVKVRAFIGPELWDGTIGPGATIELVATPATIYRNDKYHVQLSVDGYRLASVGTTEVIPECSPKEVRAEPLSVTVPRETRGLLPPPVLRPRATPEEPSREPPRYAQLRDAFVREMNALPRRFLDLDLKDLIQQPFDPDITPQLEASRIALVGAHDLSALKPDSFEVRPEQLEFIRWFLERQDNAILQAPTGSGKTEIALVIASKQRSMGHRTIFCAPTVEIQRQVKDRAPQMIDVEATLLDGHTSPQKRRKIYTEQDPSFLSAIPHVIKNDIESGIFAFRTTDLLIIDEGHHTTGDYPYVPLVRKAREAGARVLLLSATPGQIEPEKSWHKFEALKELIGVEYIFPLNVIRRQPILRPKHLELPEDMRKAVEGLSKRLEGLRDCVFEYLNKHASGELLREACSIVGSQSLMFPSANTLLPLLGRVRTMNSDRDRWGVVNSLCAIIELSELYQSLVYQGISGFLARVAEKRFEILFPVAGVKTASGKTFLAPKRSLMLVYGSSEVRRAYDCLAQGEYVGLWDARSLERLSGLTLSEWRSKTSKERRTAFNQQVSAALKRLSGGLVDLTYSDHPKERYIIDQLRQVAHKDQSIVFVRDRSHALFLTARLSHALKDYGQTAVALTGSGSGIKRGLSRDERKENLEELAAGRAQIIVSTSAGNEGIDFARVQKGFIYRFSASPIAALQQWGRIGRRDLQGEVTYLCTAPEEHGKLLSVLRKLGDFYRMLNHERQAVLDRHAARER